MLQMDSFVIILEKAIIVEGESEALMKFNKEQNQRKNNDEVLKGEDSNGSNNKRKWNLNTKDKDGDSKKKVEEYENLVRTTGEMFER